MAVNYLKVGQQFRLSLEGNPGGTGYSWVISSTQGDNAVQIGDGQYVPAQTGLIGSGGQFVFLGRAIAPGREVVTFSYERPWEQGMAVDTKVYDFHVSN